MDRLPQEIVIDILSRLPIPCLMRSKSVSRAWRTLLRDRVLAIKNFERVVENDPSFIFQVRDQPNQNQIYFGDFSSDVKAMVVTKKLTMPPLLTFHLVNSCNGLLCLRGTHESLGLVCIYNPFTLEYTELPKLIAKQPSHHVGVLGFGFDPTTNNYKVVKVSYKRYFSVVRSSSSSSIESEVHVLTVGSPAWRDLGSFPFQFMWQKSQVLVNGKLHWISYPETSEANYRILSFDLANEQFKEVPRPEFISSDKQFHELVVLRACLSAVSFDERTEELEIWVLKEYDVKESWVKEFSIQTYVPKKLEPNDQCESLNSSMYYSPKQCMRVLCLLRSGGILLEYKSKAIFAYDSNRRTFHDLHATFEGIPRCFRAVVHVASLSWIDPTFVNTFVHRPQSKSSA